MPPAGRVPGLLRVHSKVDHVHGHLHGPLRLHRAAHHAEHGERLAVLHDRAGHERVERALPRRVHVGRSGGPGTEEVPAVLQREAQGGWRQAGAEGVVVGLDPGHHHPGRVCRGEVDCVTGLHAGGVARRDHLGRARHVDERGALPRVRLGDEPLHGHARKVRVRVVLGAVRKHELLRLQRVVEVVRRVVPHGGHVHQLQHVQHLQGCDALRVGRELVHRQPRPPVAHVAGLHELAVVRRQVVRSKVQPDGAGVRVELRGDGAVVKGLAAAGCQGLEGVCEGGVREDLPLRGGATAHLVLHGVGLVEAVERAGEAAPRGDLVAVGLEEGEGLRPLGGDDLRDGEALACVLDGRSKQTRERHGGKAASQVAPAPRGARGGHRQRPCDGEGLGPVEQGHELSEGQPLGRPAGPVVADQLPRRGVPHDGEEVPAQAVGHGLRQRLHGVCRDGGVHGGAACLEDVDRGLRHQGHAARGRTVQAHGDRPRGEPPASPAVAAARRLRGRRAGGVQAAPLGGLGVAGLLNLARPGFDLHGARRERGSHRARHASDGTENCEPRHREARPVGPRRTA
mmetsp:Transcript_7513/g.29882  ORF Transcript_7513/g.29882 Transcript_7513/m.29882 type:complete len:569 (-) Transcript_7513:27-1733(-)